MAQELGLGVLIKLGMKVLTANGDDLTVTDDHMKVAMRQIAGTFAQLEKARHVAKLKQRKLRQFVVADGPSRIVNRLFRVTMLEKPRA